MSNWQDAEDEAAEELSFRPSPARKPMTEEELPNMGTPEYLTFVAGIRYAEKHHGIGGVMSEEQTHLLHQEILKALRDANQAQNGIAKPAEPEAEPVARKSLTTIEIDDALRENVPQCDAEYEIGFHSGVRWAEQKLYQ